MGWTNPKNWTTEILTSNDMNVYVRDNIDYVYDNYVLSNQRFDGTTSIGQVNIRMESGMVTVACGSTAVYGSATVTFNNTFGTAPRVLVIDGSKDNAIGGAKAISTTGFTLYTWNGSGGNWGANGSSVVSWIAIGA
jgi:hypothetical protein